MATYHLKGRITKSGELEVELPKDIPAGETQVDITIHIPADELSWEQQPWTEAELADLLKTEPKSGAEIVEWLKQEGGWPDDGLSGAEWVERMRREEEQRRNLPKW